MRTTHLESRGKSLLKRTRLKPNFARSRSVHLVTLMMILLHARDNVHSTLVVPTKLAKTGLVATINVQYVVLIQIGTLIRDKVMMPMDDPGMARAHTATVTNILRNHVGNDRARPGTFMNVLTHMMNLMKDIINSIACPGDRARKPRRA